MAYGYNFADFLSEALGMTGKHILSQNEAKRKAQQQAIQDELEWWYRKNQIDQDERRISIAEAAERRLAGVEPKKLPTDWKDLVGYGMANNDIEAINAGVSTKRALDYMDPKTPSVDTSVTPYETRLAGAGPEPDLNEWFKMSGTGAAGEKDDGPSDAQVRLWAEQLKRNALAPIYNEASALSREIVTSPQEIASLIPEDREVRSQFGFDWLAPDIVHKPAMPELQPLLDRANQIQGANWFDSARVALGGSPAQQATGVPENKPQPTMLSQQKQSTIQKTKLQMLEEDYTAGKISKAKYDAWKKYLGAQ